VSDIVGQGGFLEIQVAEPERAAEIIRALPFVERVSVQDGRLSVVAPEERGAEISRALGEANLYVTAMSARHHSLEDVFLELTDSESGREANGV
jgi:ABC-type uncharacterized transport system ATPase subunit